MASDVELSVSPQAPILHSQLVLPRRRPLLPPLPENCESLWARVNRICDQYMPEPFDMGFGPKTWRTPVENAQR